MKKILLMMLLLIAFASMLLTEEIDREKIMFKKLIYSELPDDCPKEIYEYFKASYKYHMLAEDEIGKLISNEYNPFSEKEILHLTYLQWVLMHRIPKYWFEYKLINSPTIDLGKKFPIEDVIKFSHRYTSEEINQLDRALPHFFIYLLQSAGKIAEIPKTDLKLLFYVWVKAKIVDKKLVKIKGISNNFTRYTTLVKLEIIESLYTIPYKEIYIRAHYTGGNSLDSKQNILNTDDEFIIPIRWDITDFEDQVTFNDNSMESPNIMGYTRLIDCMRIDKEGYAEYFDYTSTDFGIMGFHQYTNWIEKIFNRRVKFNDFKVKIEKVLKKLRTLN